MKIAVIGAGSWGTALAQLLAKNGHSVGLWARKDEVVSAINAEHRNPRYLSEITLAPSIVASVQYETVLAGAYAIVVVTPSSILRDVARRLACSIAQDTKDAQDIQDVPILLCSKGVEEHTGKLPIDIFSEELGDASRLAVLSGPNHAEEVISGIPSATVIAAQSQKTALFFRDICASDTFRAYTSEDICGVQLCAAFKNVIAIAVGISYGMGFGDNTASLLVSRGLAEMSRLVVSCGGEALTCMGLAGTGDMVATCMSQHSRNRRFGEFLAQGKSLEDFTSATHMVAEGALACRNIGAVAAEHGVELPICEAVRTVVWESADPGALARELISRPLKQEFYF